MCRAIEYHHAIDKWYECESEQEIAAEDLRGPCEKDLVGQALSDAFYQAWKDSQVVYFRSNAVQVTGFSGFYCGYDVSRYYLTPMA